MRNLSGGISYRGIKLTAVSLVFASALIDPAADVMRLQPAPAEFILLAAGPLNTWNKLSDSAAAASAPPALPPCPAATRKPADSESYFCSQLLDNGGAPSVHAATLASLPGGGIGVWWYGGSREGAKDVSIYFARYSHESGEFSPARVVVTREQLSSQLGRHIKKLGNPAAVLDQSGRIWLFFVSVSVGGWAGSALNVIVSEDGGGTWSPAKRLVTSPFFNVSTLARAAPVPLASGELMIPAYHEFIGKFSEILIVSGEGEVKDKRRVTWGRRAVQPWLVPRSASGGTVFMRSKSDREPFVHSSSTEDSGMTFQPARTMDLPNADNSVAAARLGGDGFWIVYNSDKNGRRALAIAAASADGSDAQWITDLENALDDPGKHEFSYPSVITDYRGLHHVAWTHNRKHIKHAVFTHDWLFARVNQGRETP